MIETLIAPIQKIVGDVLNRILPPEKMSEAEWADVQMKVAGALLTADTSAFENQVKVLLAEMSGNWLQKSWRPLLMLAIIAIVVNNYILFPYLSLFTSKAVMLTLPDDLWSLLKLGVGGYVVGRSAEKIAETLKQKQGG